MSAGDVCLPPNHPEAVRTPDLCDRFRRFEFNVEDNNGSSSAAATPTLISPAPVQKAKKASPPQSPSVSKVTSSSSSKKEKGEKDENKPKRPMNGFMLFAKKYRLELIQQHPGKDNRLVCLPSIFDSKSIIGF